MSTVVPAVVPPVVVPPVVVPPVNKPPSVVPPPPVDPDAKDKDADKLTEMDFGCEDGSVGNILIYVLMAMTILFVLLFIIFIVLYLFGRSSVASLQGKLKDCRSGVGKVVSDTIAAANVVPKAA